jgi:hypothetical protein
VVLEYQVKVLLVALLHTQRVLADLQGQVEVVQVE